MERRQFLKYFGASAIGLLLYGCHSAARYSAKMVDSFSEIGHLLREPLGEYKIINEESIQVLIVGAGISGLSAARQLNASGDISFKVVEMLPHFGGNSCSGKNDTSAFPWGAHYLPLVNNNLTELLDFLKEHNVITHFENGLPFYNEEYLCFDNEERLYNNGIWQEGLVPQVNNDTDYNNQLSIFNELVAFYATMKAKDGKFYFTIPVADAVLDEQSLEWSRSKAITWLKEKGLQHPILLWYLNYCISDDYGCSLKQVSTWAFLQYFCARRATAANAYKSSLLTWPEGNQFLAHKLQSSFANKIKYNTIVRAVQKQDGQLAVIIQDTKSKDFSVVKCQHLILNTPHHITKKIAPFVCSLDDYNFEHFPWAIANITVEPLPELSGMDLSWDNVIMKSKSLGYVVANHQAVNTPTKYVFTCYHAFNNLASVDERKALREMSITTLEALFIDELKVVYPDIVKSIISIEIKTLGHGMIAPLPNTIFSKAWQYYQTPKENIYFCHTDYCGISIFEEAFYKGLTTGKNILKVYGKS
jgi:hypothetical protein